MLFTNCGIMPMDGRYEELLFYVNGSKVWNKGGTQRLPQGAAIGFTEWSDECHFSACGFNVRRYCHHLNPGQLLFEEDCNGKQNLLGFGNNFALSDPTANFFEQHKMIVCGGLFQDIHNDSSWVG